MTQIEIRLRQVGNDKAWEQVTPNLVIRLDASKASSYYVFRFIEAAYPQLAVCEARWNVLGSFHAEYFEYRRAL